MKQAASELSVLSLAGALDVHHHLEVRRQVLDGVLAARGDLLLDLRRATVLDSSGISVLIGAHRRLELRGHRLLLIIDDLPTLRRLERLGLLNTLLVFPSADAALTFAWEAQGATPVS